MSDPSTSQHSRNDPAPDGSPGRIGPLGSSVSPELANLVAGSITDLVAAMSGSTNPELEQAVAAVVEPIRLTAGETLIHSGDEPDAAYFVITGRLSVLSEDDGDEITLNRLGRGEIIGEMGLLGDMPRVATVRADRDSVLARIPRSAFDDLAGRDPDFMRGVARVVVRRLVNPPPPSNSVGTVAVAVAHPDLDAGLLSDRLFHVMEATGTVARLSSIAPERALGAAGIAQAEPGSVEWFQLVRHLETVEAGHRFVLFEADREPSAWSATALRRADRVLIVTSATPDPREEATARAFAAAAGADGRSGKWIVSVWPEGTETFTGSAALASRYGAERVLHMRRGSAADAGRIARLATGTGVGLVLGGGGARGFAHLGVYRALAELGLPIDAVAGASIGGVFAAVIGKGVAPDQAVGLSTRAFSKVLDYTLPMVSLVKGNRISRRIGAEFDGMDVEDLLLPFLCVSTNLTTSRQVVHDRGPVTRAIRAGLAIPGIIPPVPQDGHLLVDGGVLDNLPVDHLRSTGLVDTIVAVDVAPPVGPRARADFGLSVSGWQAFLAKFRRGKRRYPALSVVLLRSMLVGSMRERDRLVSLGRADLYLDLELRGVSLLAFDEVRAVAEAGYEAARPRIEAWMEDRDPPAGTI